MNRRLIHILHVEDDPTQQLVVRRLLAKSPEFEFSVETSISEDDAVERFTRRPAEFVIADYQLEQGNGLKCLQRIREQDRIVPILVLSGVAGPEVFSELLLAGAADCIAKRDLTYQRLHKSVSEAITSTDVWRARLPARAYSES